MKVLPFRYCGGCWPSREIPTVTSGCGSWRPLPNSSQRLSSTTYCADREFIGQAWVRYLLLEPALAFRLRIRGTDQLEHDGKVLAARVVFAHLQVGQAQRLTGTWRVWGYPVAVEALRLDDGDLLVVIGPVKAQGLVQDYALRWGIEISQPQYTHSELGYPAEVASVGTVFLTSLCS